VHGFGHAGEGGDTGFPSCAAGVFVEGLSAAPFGEKIRGGDRVFRPGGKDGFTDQGGVDIVAGVAPWFDTLEAGPVEEFIGWAVIKDLPGELFEMPSQGVDEAELWLGQAFFAASLMPL
jgi:hypothetical protein